MINEMRVKQDSDLGSSDTSYGWQMVEMLLRRKGYLIAIPTLCVLGAIAFTRSITPLYTARSTLLIEKSEATPTNMLPNAIQVDQRSADYYQTQYEILQSYTLAKTVFDELHLGDLPEFRDMHGGDPVEVLRKRIKISPIKGSRIVAILATWRDPNVAAAIPNSIAKNYIQASAGTKMFLSDAMKRLLDDTATVADIEALPEVVSSTLIQSLKIQLNHLKQNWAELSSRYRREHAQMIAIQRQVDATQAEIDHELQNIAESVKAATMARYKQSGTRILDFAAVPTSPSSPKMSRNILSAFAGGVFLAWVVVLVLHQSDRALYNTASVEAVTGVASLPSLPQLILSQKQKSPQGFVDTWSFDHSTTTRAFRSLRTALSVKLGALQPPGAFIIGSSVQGEGKSFVAANLAASFRLAGESVLLIDGDILKPALGKVFPVDQEIGLSTYLSTDDLPEQHVVQTALDFYFMPAGRVSTSTAELLSSAKLAYLLEWSRSQFQRIIIDAPPIIAAPDTLAWLAHVPYAIFVVEAGSTPRDLVQASMEILRNASGQVLGTVLNKVPDMPSYYFYNEQRRD